MDFSLRARITLIVLVVLALMAGGAALLITPEVTPPPEVVEVPQVEEIATTTPVLQGERVVIGSSVEGRDIAVYTFGTGDTDVLFVGGIHGGYEWNSVLLAYEMIDHLTETPALIPENVTVRIIPALNPDGVYKVIGKEGRFVAEDAPASSVDTSKARFNARGVDLNRNFDCKWQPESMWRGTKVSAGTSAFSEPEAVALQDHVLATSPDAVVFWHSKANAVYASECEEGILPLTRTIMDTYARAAGYTAVDTFDAYPVTGDAEGWLASIGIPAITVELSTHETIEWTKNLAGVEALLATLSSSSMAR